MFFRDGRAGATGRNGLSHASRYCACHVARVPKRRRKVPCGETEREFSETPGMPAGQTGGTRSGGLAGGDRTTWARGHHAGTVGLSESVTGEARPAAVRREPHGVAGMPPTGARRQRPPARRGDAAVVTGPYGASLKPPATPGDLYYGLMTLGSSSSLACVAPLISSLASACAHSSSISLFVLPTHCFLVSCSIMPNISVPLFDALFAGNIVAEMRDTGISTVV